MIDCIDNIIGRHPLFSLSIKVDLLYYLKIFGESIFGKSKMDKKNVQKPKGSI
jgi:hypothetical protein